MKKKLLVLLSAACVLSMVACGDETNETNAETKTSSNSSTESVSNIEESSENNMEDDETVIVGYESSKLKVHNDVEKYNLEGKISAFSDYGGEYILKDNIVYFCGSEREVTKVTDNVENIISVWDFTAVVKNTDGTYAVCKENNIYPFMIEEGELIDARLYADLNSELCVQSVVKIDNKLYMNIHDIETKVITETFEVRHEIGDLSDEYINSVEQIKYYQLKTYFLLDDSGRLYRSLGDSEISARESQGVKYGEGVLLSGVRAENVEKFYGFNSYWYTPVYSKSGDTSHLFVMKNGEKISDDATEIKIALPTEYAVNQITEVLILSGDMLVVFNDGSVYVVDVDKQEWEKHEEVSELNKEGKVIQFGTCGIKFVVLMDDNTLYEIK